MIQNKALSTSMRSSVGTVALVLLGNTLYAVGVTAFVVQGGLITGGTTGIALVFNWLWGVSIPLFTAISNILMFILGCLLLGKKFAVTTALSTFYIPVALGVCERLPILQNLTQDKMLCVIYAGILIGGGLGLVLRAGASTGGMDIPPLIMEKYWKLPLAVGIYLIDFTILLGEMLLVDKEQVLYGILLVILYSIMVDQTLRFQFKKTAPVAEGGNG